MKSLLILFIFLPTLAHSQNIIFEKQVNTQLEKPIWNVIHNNVQYTKTKEEQIIRVDKDGISLYTNDMERIWRVELEQVKSVGNENYFYCSPQEDYIYLAQYGTAFSNDNCMNRLHQFSYKEGEHKTVEINEIIPFRAISNIETIDDKVIVFGVGTKGVFTPYGSKFVAFQPIIILDQALNIVDTSNALPMFLEETNYNVTWGFDRRENDKLIFNTYYMVDKNGKPTDKRQNAVNEFRQYLAIANDGTITYGEKIDFEKVYRKNNTVPVLYSLKYDPKVYNVYVDGDLVEKYRFHNLPRLTDLEIKNSDVSSGNLMDQFFEMTGNGSINEGYRGFYLYEILYDPINDNLQLIGKARSPNKPGKKKGVDKGYVITLNKSLKITHIQENNAITGMWSCESYTHRILSKTENLRSWGEFPEGYSMNGVDYIHQRQIKYAILTIINLEKSQLVLIDDFDSKTTTAIKVGK